MEELVIKKQETLGKEEVRSLLGSITAPEGFIYASGGKFHTLFGRDSIITSLELLPDFPEVAKCTIKSLAKHQNENGQILHELGNEKTGWDSLDSTPLFLILISEYYKETKDIQMLEDVKENIDRGLHWIKNFGDHDGDGFLEYYENAKGLAHMSWKDSKDGTTYQDKTIPEYPIAPAEVQGYLYKAYLEISSIYIILGEKEKGEDLKERANTLKKKFNKEYWDDERKFFVIALDKDHHQVKTVSSNIGHCLWSGILDDEKVDTVVERMLREDLMTIYGLRTLSEKMGNFDPFSYHNGSIWPFDNWFFAEGLEKYGYKKEAERVRTSVLNALDYLGSPYECYTYIDKKLDTKLKDFGGADLLPEKIQAWTLGAMWSFLSKK